jgi:hypothetical protein
MRTAKKVGAVMAAAALAAAGPAVAKDSVKDKGSAVAMNIPEKKQKNPG